MIEGKIEANGLGHLEAARHWHRLPKYPKGFD